MKALRARGVNVIEHDFFDVVKYWPSSTRVDVIIADLTCGVNGRVQCFMMDICHNSAIRKGSVISINVMRGRDLQLMNQGLRKLVQNSHQLYDKSKVKKIKENKKHRAQHLLLDMRGTILTCDPTTHYKVQKAGGNCRTREVYNQALRTEKYANFTIKSYRSARGMYFDSLVFRMPVTGELYEIKNGINWSWIDDPYYHEKVKLYEDRKRKEARKKITPALAIRTTRKNKKEVA